MFTPEETVRAIRAALISEEEAISLYTAQAEQIEDPFVKEVLLNVAKEEKVHQGEFITVLRTLGDWSQIKDGELEVEKIMKELDIWNSKNKQDC